MEDENISNPSSAGSSKKRKISMVSNGHNSVLKIELEARNFEILKLKERIAQLEDASENEREDAEIIIVEPNEDNQKKELHEKLEQMDSIIKEKDQEITQLKIELNENAKSEENLQAIIEGMENHIKILLQQIKKLKENQQSEILFTEITVDKIYSESGGIHYNLLAPEIIVMVPKLQSAQTPFWKLFSDSSENSSSFEMDISSTYKRTLFKIGLNDSLIIIDQINPNRINEIVPAVYTWTHKYLHLSHQIFDEYVFKKLASETVKIAKLDNITVLKKDGTSMNGVEIFAEFPLVEDYHYVLKSHGFVPLEMSDEKFFMFPKFKNLKNFKLSNVEGTFDLEVFSKFMIRHPNTVFIIQYQHSCKDSQSIKKAVEKLSKACKIAVEFGTK